MLRLLAASDVFVLASRHEGLPVALMEATSMGLPIVVTGVEVSPGALTTKWMCGCRRWGTDSLAEAIERLAGDPGLVYSDSAGGQGAAAPCSTLPSPAVGWMYLHPARGRRRPRG